MPMFVLRCAKTPAAHGRKQCRLGLACRLGGLVQGEHWHGRQVVERPVLVVDYGMVVYHWVYWLEIKTGRDCNWPAFSDNIEQSVRPKKNSGRMRQDFDQILKEGNQKQTRKPIYSWMFLQDSCPILARDKPERVGVRIVMWNRPKIYCFRY